MRFAERYAALGFDGITLADTTGMANPAQVHRIAQEAVTRLPSIEFTLHFHNTRGMGLANVVAGIDAGILSYDGSLAGLGGCPSPRCHGQHLHRGHGEHARRHGL